MEKQDLFKDVIRTLVSVVEYKSKFFRGHSERVAANCIKFARYLALQKDFVNNLYFAGLLYDIGMVYIPMEIINKADTLSDDEFKIVKDHPIIAVNILSHLYFLKSALPMIRHHHENHDGSGYPDGLAGDKIPLGSKILSILDSYDAMISERPHRAAFSPDEALRQIRAGAGTIYDPLLVGEFIKFITQQQTTAPEKRSETPTAKAPMPGAAAQPSLQAHENSIQKAVSDVVIAFKRGIIEAPAFPVVISKIQDALRSTDKGLEDVARIIEQDQVVTLMLLSMSRSVHYGGNANISTVTQALSRIGMKDAQSIISAIAMKSMYETGEPRVKSLMGKFWIHAVATAHTARAIARHLHERDEESLFLLGLTHDVGKVLLLNGLAKRLFTEPDGKSVDMERMLESIQAVHASFGAALLKKWGFKNEYINAVSNHESPDYSSGTSRTNLILYLANILTRRMGYSMHEDQPESLGQVIAYLELDSAAVAAILEETKQIVQDTLAT